MKSIKFGPKQKFQLTEPLDTWLSAGLRDFAVPEAIGSSARVFRLKYPDLAGDYGDYPAIKVMRPDKTDYALPLFFNEVRILENMKDVPGVTGTLGLGFLQVESGDWPKEIAPLTKTLQLESSGSQLSGNAEFYSPGEHLDFLEVLENKVKSGWLAFIVLPHRWEDNLFLRCDSGYTRGEFQRTFPVINALEAAFQISEILQAAHERKIIYLDHKVLHYYWNEPRRQVFVLDWNIGRMINNENSEEVYEFDVLQFSARALHHLLTGRQAPGSVKIGPNKPEEIQNAPHHYDPIWTYDDQKRLTPSELDFLTGAIQGQYKTAKELGADLKNLIEFRRSQN